MTSKTTWLLVLTAGTVFALIFFVERPVRLTREQRPEPKVFLDLNSQSIKAVQVRPTGQFDIRVEKTNGVWQLVRPVNYPADAAQIEKFLSELSLLKWQDRITAEQLHDRPNAQEEFGLASPQFSLTLQREKSATTLHIGSKTVAGDQVFAQVVGGDGLFVLSADVLELLPQKADEWRDPAALPATLSSANGIEVRSGNKFFRLEFDATNQLWRMIRPLDARANDTKIRQLLGLLAAARATEFVSDDAGADFEKFGLPNMAAQNPELALTFFDGTNVLAGLQVGLGPTNGPGRVFARRTGQSLVFLLAENVIAPWRGTPADFRDRRLILFSPEKINAIEFQGEDHFSMQRQTNRSWLVKNGIGFPADAETARDLLVILGTFEMNFENDVVTDFAPFGLENPILQCAVHGTITNAIARVEQPMVERLQFGTNENDKVFLRRNDQARVYSISRRDFDLLPRASWQLRERHVWSFHPTNVVSVTIRQHGRTRKINHTAENQWSIAAGSQGVVNPFSLEEAMHRLGQLKPIFWSSRGEGGDETFGFAEAAHQIEIELNRAGKTEILSLTFGGFSAFRHPYAAVHLDGQRMVFEFPLPLYLEFVRRDLSIVPAPLPPLPPE